MSLLSLPTEVLRQIAVGIADREPNFNPNDRKLKVSRLCLVCKTLHDVCQPLMYRHIRFQRESCTDWLLPVISTLLTKPEYARQVVSIRFQALSWSPNAKQVRKIGIPLPSWNDPPAAHSDTPSNTRRGWPAGTPLSLIREKISEALQHLGRKAVNKCYKLVASGDREDLVAMLLLSLTPNVQSLNIAPMGPFDDDSFTRALFCYAAPNLTRLTEVSFGNEDEWTDDSSFALFADCLKLPSVKIIHAIVIAPQFQPRDRTWTSQIDFISEMTEDCVSLKTLVANMQLIADDTPLDHLLQRCPSLDRFEVRDLYMPFVYIFSGIRLRCANCMAEKPSAGARPGTLKGFTKG